MGGRALNPMKSEMRMGVIKEVGGDIGRLLESAKSDVQKHMGATEALANAAKKVEELQARFDAEADKEQDFELKDRAVIKRWIERSRGVVHNLMLGEQQAVQQTVGKVTALTSALDVLQKKHEAERSRLVAFEKAVADGSVVVEGDSQTMAPDVRRVRGAHPGPRIADLRREAEAGTNGKEAEEQVNPDATNPG